MRDLSLHLLDLAQNSITAGASLVSISITVDENGFLTFILRDDGKGMSPELLRRVTSPFATTRTTRKVGLGIPMMMENAQRAGGDLTLESTEGVGTTVTVVFPLCEQEQEVVLQPGKLTEPETTQIQEEEKNEQM